MNRRLAKALRWTGAVAALLAIVLGAVVVVVSSDWFREQVRQRIIREAEKATGGDIEIAEFNFDWRTLTAEVRGFQIHGREVAGSDPLFQAARLIVELKVVSALRRDVDLERIEIHQPALSLRRMPDGRLNFPDRLGREGPSRDYAGLILRLAAGEFRLADGTWRYEDSGGGLDLEGKRLAVSAEFLPSLAGYGVEVAWQQMAAREPWSTPVAFDAEAAFTYERGTVTIERANFATEGSALETSGRLETGDGFTANLTLSADMAISDLKDPLRLPVEPTGSVRFNGSLEYPNSEEFSVTGEMTAAGLAVRTGRVNIDGIGAAGSVRAGPETIELPNLTATTMGGRFAGSATVRSLQSFEVHGKIADFAIARILPRVKLRPLGWNGVFNGPVQVSGALRGPVSGTAGLTIQPHGPSPTVEGFVQTEFDTEVGDVSFQESTLSVGSSRIGFSGTLKEGLQLSAYTENLPEILPPLGIFGITPPDPFPVALRNGVAQFGGLITGIFDQVRIAGHVAAGPFEYQGRLIESGAADFDLERNRLRLRSLTLRHEETEVHGDFELSLGRWRYQPESAISGEFQIPAGSLATFLSMARRELPLDGAVTGLARLAGTLDGPVLTGQAQAQDITAYGERIDRAGAAFHLSKEGLRIQQGYVRAASGEMRVGGSYIPDAQGWSSGELTFNASAERFRLNQFEAVREVSKGLDAAVRGGLSGNLRFGDGEARLGSLEGKVSVAELSLNDRPLGAAEITAEMRRNILIVRAEAGVQEATIRSNAQWDLDRTSFGLGQVTFSNLTLDALQTLGLFGGPETDIYVVGSLDGEIGFVGPVLRPSEWRGLAKITRLEVTPAVGEPATDRDLTMRNEGSVLLAIEPSRVSVESARIRSADTDLEIEGTLSYLRRNPWNLQVKGAVDLAVLTAFRNDLLAEGGSTIDTVIRGSLLQPQVNGHLLFDDASFYLRDLPNGLEQVNGAILFNRTRATIEKFTSKTGGGNLELDGFIGFGGEEWVYRLQAKAERVRVRYPEGVSTLLNAGLDLTGTSTRSLLSGDVQVTRASFNPESDLGSILSDSARARPATEISNPFLRGMQFDLNITTAANAEILTSLTRDVELEAELRLRGTVVRPVLLGRVGINRGEIQFFGNRYDIVQGEVNFFNPVKIEPVVAMDLETRIRGFTVMMNFSGPLDKLNFSYRSDPPLQSQEIIALLTVGRAPTYAGSPSTSNPAGTNYFQAGGSSFLGHALTAPVSSRLQRFFGVSRIKIDPQLTGVDNTPETHVTIEQQVSRDIALTYVTNLTQTQQQIVRVEWNFLPDWSVYVIRDSNGVFGMDFIYRRRFK